MNERHPLLAEELDRIAALNLPYERLDGKTVAVTGAGGLVGNYLMRALDAVRRAHGLNLTLIALCRSPERSRAQLRGVDALTCIEYDATRPLTADFRADYVLHAAANAHPLAFSSDPVGTMQGNILGTMNLLEHMRETGGRFILFSTGEIYGERPDLPGGFDETSFGSVDPMNPRACYPESKRAAETLCAAYARQYGVDALAARLTYTYGASITDQNSRADAQFLRRALAGEDIVLKSVGAVDPHAQGRDGQSLQCRQPRLRRQHPRIRGDSGRARGCARHLRPPTGERKARLLRCDPRGAEPQQAHQPRLARGIRPARGTAKDAGSQQTIKAQ